MKNKLMKSNVVTITLLILIGILIFASFYFTRLPNIAYTLIFGGIFFMVVVIQIEAAKDRRLDIFDPKFLDSIGFKVEKDDGQYGKAIDVRTKGMTVLEWNREGPTINYFGEPIKKGAVYFGIKKDAGTRNAFSGYIYGRADLQTLLKLTW